MKPSGDERYALTEDPPDAPLRLMQNDQGQLFTNRRLTDEELRRLSLMLFPDLSKLHPDAGMAQEGE